MVRAEPEDTPPPTLVQRTRALLAWFPLDWFLVGMILAAALAWVFPDPGAEGGILLPDLTNKLGVALIFFLHGVALSFQALRQGTLRWPVHLVVQMTTYALFPLLGVVLIAAGGGWMTPGLRLGFFYLCALPSTVSSSVAMTAVARGNVPVAVFNASLSSLLGIVLTPLLVSWALPHGGGGHGEAGAGGGMDFGRVLLDLIIWLLLPLVAGQLVRPLLGAWVGRHKKRIGVIDRLVILFLVYTSFCDSVKAGVWTGQGVQTVAVTLFGCTILFWIVFGAVSLVCAWMRLPRPDRIAAIFCGSKKTLASGVPMARLIFGADPGLSLILLPIMIYHPLQLFICSVLASRWARQGEEPSEPGDGAPETPGS